MGTSSRVLTGGACLALLLGAAAARGQRAPLAPGAQPAVFEKIFGYDRALGDKAAVQVLIVRGAAPPPAELEQGFRGLGIRAEQVPASEVGGRLGPGVVVYLTDETATPAMLDQIAKARVLSVAGDPALAESGRASVALADSGGRPEIVVNLDRVGAEGHDFPAQLLKVARVVRGAASPAGGSGFQPAVIVSFDRPAYPMVARRLGAQGDVVMRLQVDATGAVTQVELVKGVSASGGIDAAAMQAARTARFKPATQDGKPVASVYTLTVPFRL